MQSPVAYQKEQEPDDDAGAYLRPRGPLTFHESPNHKNGSGKGMAKARGVKRRDGCYRIPNGQISRAPDDIDGQKRQYDCGAAGRIACNHNLTSAGQCLFTLGKNRCFRGSTHVKFSLWRVMTLMLYTHYKIS